MDIQKLDDAKGLRPIDSSRTQAYIAKDKQTAGIIEFIIKCRPAKRYDIFQTTFSISEEFLRRMYFIKQRSGCSLSVVVDAKALNKIKSLWRFIAQVYDEVWLAENHSKVVICKPDDGKPPVAVLTSQNLTRGNRFESSVISTDPDMVGPLIEGYADLVKNHSAPLHEIMPQALDNKPHEDESTIDIIERLAGYFVSISDIAVIIEADPNELRNLIADPETAESAAYRRGKAKAKVAVRAQEMELARVGSPLGMASVRENLLSMEADED